MKPLISIITVCFNSAKTIRQTIESVLNQTYTNIEYILVDGKSTDNTMDIIQEYEPKFAEKGIIYRWISEPDNGIYDAMNKGIKMATGEWIGIINSDDWYESDNCEIIQKNSNLKNTIIYGTIKYWKNNRPLFIKKNEDIRLLNKGMVIPHPSVFMTKSIYKKNGLFNTNLKIAADWELMIRAWKNQINFYYIKELKVNFACNGISSEINYQTISEKHQIRKLNNLYKFMDIYYLIDLIKVLILPNNLIYKFSLFKQKTIAKLIR